MYSSTSNATNMEESQFMLSSSYLDNVNEENAIGILLLVMSDAKYDKISIYIIMYVAENECEELVEWSEKEYKMAIKAFRKWRSHRFTSIRGEGKILFLHTIRLPGLFV
jgi:hypothetical protein